MTISIIEAIAENHTIGKTNLNFGGTEVELPDFINQQKRLLRFSF